MSNFRIVGIVDGREVELPQELDGIVIQTPSGGLYIDLEVEGLGGVLVRGVSEGDRRPAIIMSPLESGRLLLGVAPVKS